MFQTFIIPLESAVIIVGLTSGHSIPVKGASCPFSLQIGSVT